MNEILTLAVTLSGVGLLTFWIWDRSKVKRRIQLLEAKVSGEVVPFWRAIQNEAIVKLTHPHESAERADELLQLLKEDPTIRMTDEDRAELERRMTMVAAGDDPMIQGEDERNLARIFPIIMKEVEKEVSNPNPISDVQIVGLKQPQVNGV